MTETITVGTFEDGVDPVTGEPTRVPGEVKYSGKARIRLASREVTNAQGPGDPVAVQEPYLSVPYGTVRLFEGEQVLCTASAADELLVGRMFDITGSAQAGQTSAHRYPLDELG